MQKYGCIFCNGEYIHTNQEVQELLENADCIIAADGGLKHLKSLNISPNAIIGDMDSTNPELLNQYSAKIMKFPTKKSQTDTELAVDHLISLGYQTIFLIGATGKRLDHELGNISLMANKPGLLFVVDKDSLSFALGKNSSSTTFQRPKEAIVSIIPFSQQFPCLTTAGLEYPLNNQFLENSCHGISNIVNGEQTQITLNNDSTAIISIEGIFPIPKIH